jgi:hypothetical protein
MSIRSRIASLLRDQGPRAILIKLWGRGLDAWYEWQKGIDTLSIRHLDSLTIHDGDSRLGHYYEGSRLMPLRCLIPKLQSMVLPTSALVDCGCGKGKVLLVAGECGVAEIRGVEFATELCDIARSNWDKVFGRSESNSRCEILCSDILNYEIRDNDSMFFLFNPFEPQVLEALLQNIQASIQRTPRQIVIAAAFLSDTYAEVFDRFPCFTNKSEVVYWACRFSLFGN